jgi:hypothetical protein
MLSPHEIVQYWQIKHQILSDASREKFIRRTEILKLSLLPIEHVYAAIRADQRLSEILKTALQLTAEDQNLSQLDMQNYESIAISDALNCEHGLKTYSKCEKCRPVRPYLRQKMVWMSGRGGKFHYNKYCEFARAAQQELKDLGGNPHHWFSGSENVVKWSRNPCKACVINNPLGFEWFENED